MSVELQEQRVRYLGNGTASTFAFWFTIEEPEQVQVVRADAAGTESTLVLNTDYSVTLNSDGTGSVTLNQALPTGYVLALISNISATQERAFYNNTPYYQEQIEGALDKNTRLIQQLEEKLERSVKVNATSSLKADELVSDLLQARIDARDSAAAAALSEQAASDSEDAARIYEEQTAELLAQTEQTVAQAKEDIETQRAESVQSVITQQESSVQAVLTQQESSVQAVQTQQESSVRQVQAQGSTSLQTLQDQEAASLALMEAEVSAAKASSQSAEQSSAAAAASEQAAAESAAKAENFAQSAFPAQSGHAGHVLATDGETVSWVPPAAPEAGTGIDVTDNVVSLAAYGTAGSYGPSANASPAHGGSFSVPHVTTDAYGRTTASTKTITLPAAFTPQAGAGISVSGSTVSLATSGATAGTYGPTSTVDTYTSSFYVPKIVVDKYGRVTSIANIVVYKYVTNCSDCSTD